jgi:SAM-dependent methyltransferase
MQRDTDSDWKLIAETDPYWGVISVDEFKGQELRAEAIDRFFEGGENSIANLFAFINKYLAIDLKPQRSLDFGCGVGRLLIPIARRSGEAVGVDIAPRMLELAKQHCTRMGVENAEVVLGDDDLSRVTGKFDFINTYIVMQHIPPERGYVIMNHLIDLLTEGGVISLQLTFAKSRSFLHHEIGRADYYRRDGNTVTDLVVNPHQREGGAITMFDYDLNETFARLSHKAQSPILVSQTNEDNHLGVHLIFRRA